MSFWGKLRLLFAHRCDGEIRQAAQVNHSGNTLLKTAARQQSVHAKQVEREARAHIRDDDHAEALDSLVKYMNAKGE
jgi:hypothetical protein